jgi:hypothetical protein
LVAHDVFAWTFKTILDEDLRDAMVPCLADLTSTTTAEFVFGLVANTFGVTVESLLQRLRSTQPSIYPKNTDLRPVIGERVYRRSVRMLFGVLSNLHLERTRAIRPDYKDCLVLLKLMARSLYTMSECEDIFLQYLKVFVPLVRSGTEPVLEELSVDLLKDDEYSGDFRTSVYLLKDNEYASDFRTSVWSNAIQGEGM